MASPWPRPIFSLPAASLSNAEMQSPGNIPGQQVHSLMPEQPIDLTTPSSYSSTVQSPAFTESVSPSTEGHGKAKRKKRGAPGVKWEPSKERKLARLYSIADIDIDDIPIVMRDDDLRFEKRHAQEKLSAFLGPRPNDIRRRPVDEDQMDKRIEKSYALKMKRKLDHLRNRSAQQFHEYGGEGRDLHDGLEDWATGKSSTSSNGVVDGDTFAPPQSLPLPRPPFPSYQQDFAEFTKKNRAEGLRQRMLERGRDPTKYSSTVLNKFEFIMNRLSASTQGSWQSKSTTTTSRSLTSSWSSRDSTQTITRSFRGSLGESIRVRSISEYSTRSSIPNVRNSTSASLRYSTPVRPYSIHQDTLGDFSLPPSKKRNTSTVDLPWASVPNILQPWSIRDSLDLYGVRPSMEAAEASSQRKSVIFDEPMPTRNEEPGSQPDPTFALMEELLDYEAYAATAIPALSDQSDPANDISSDTKNGSSQLKIEDRGCAQVQHQQIHRSRDCCSELSRGDPRSSRCLECLLEEPSSHMWIGSVVQAWKDGNNTPIAELYDAKTAASCNFVIDEVDGFHNTILHSAASYGAGTMILVWLIEQGISVDAKNAAGQTFMHTLNPVSFAAYGRGSDERSSEDITSLLSLLSKLGFDFHDCDDYGQTPMHVLTQYDMSLRSTQRAFEGMGGFSTNELMKRDFRGRKLIRRHLEVQRRLKAQTVADTCELPLLQPMMLPIRENTTDNAKPGQKLAMNSLTIGDDKAQYHESLRKTITLAISGHPGAENCGMNGLHCLAESCLTVWAADGTPANGDANKSLKRKSTNDKTFLRLRHDYIIAEVGRLIKSKVDVNAYNSKGNTPIMSFIKRGLAHNTTVAVLRLLIQYGANVHRRNRSDETALHIAMRLSRIAAVEVLVQNNANVHAKDRHGKGVLAIAAKASAKAARKGDAGLYARAVTCTHIAVDYGAVVEPSRQLDWDQQIRCYAEGRP